MVSMLIIFGIFTGPLLGACISLKKVNARLIICSSLITAVFVFIAWCKLGVGGSIQVAIGYAKHGFSINELSIVFVSTIAILYPIAMIFTLGYIQASASVEKKKEFLFLLHVAIACGLGVAMSNSLLIMFVFYEMITAFTYPLIIGNKTRQSKTAASYYLAYLVGGSTLLLLPAILCVKHFGGSIHFTDNGIYGLSNLSKWQINALFFAFVFGFAKSAVVPLHKWLLKAMIAPAPVSAMLHAVIVVKSGLFGIIAVANKIFGLKLLAKNIYTMGIGSSFQINIFSAFCFITVFFSAIVATTKDNLKERLAYSTISQASYCLLALSMFSTSSTYAAMTQFISHAITKITLFFVAGSVYLLFHNYSVKNLTSIWKVAPMVAIATMFGSLSVIGMPPTIGFYAKYQILSSILETGSYGTIFLTIVALSLSVFYVFSLLYGVCFLAKKQKKQEDDLDANSIEIVLPAKVSVALLLLSILSFASIPLVHGITKFL